MVELQFIKKYHLDNQSYNLTPDALADSLNAMTLKNKSDKLDNGKVWN